MSVTIRLQYLPLSAQAADIRNFFSGLRIPDGAVHIVGGEDGDVFVGFASDEDARQAMTRSGGKIHGTEVRLLLSSKSEMQDVIARIKAGHLAQPHVADKKHIDPPASNPWQTGGSSVVSPHNLLNPSRYLPEQNVGQPAYLRLSPKPTEPMYQRVPPPVNANAYQMKINGKVPTYPPAVKPLGRQAEVIQVNYGDTDNHYKASPAYTSPRYQQSPAFREAEAKPYGYAAVEHGKPDLRPVLAGGMIREAEDAISKLPPHLRPPHGIPPPHLRHLFPNLVIPPANPVLDAPPRDPAPRRDDHSRPLHVPPAQEYAAGVIYGSNGFSPRYQEPSHLPHDRFIETGPPRATSTLAEKFPEKPPVNTDSWRAAGRNNQPWDNRSNFDKPMNDRKPMGGPPFPDRRDFRGSQPQFAASGPPPHIGQRGPPLPLHENPNRSAFWKYLELSRLPNELLRPAALEEFIKPSVPFSVSAVKVVFRSQGIHLHTLVRVENIADFDRIMRRDGDQGIRVRTTSKQAFDEAIDGIPPAFPLPAGNNRGPAIKNSTERRPSSRGNASSSSSRTERSPPARRRRSRSRSPSRGGRLRRERTRSRSPRRRRPRSRSPLLGRRGGRQEPNRWCLMLTNVPFKAEPEELMGWLCERVKPIKLTRTFYADGNASDRWVAEFESESSMKRAENHRRPLNNRTIKTTYIDNDYADEILAIEDKYGENRKREYDMKQMAELQLQHLNGTLGPHGVPRFFNNPASSCPQVPQQHYVAPGAPHGQRPPMDPHSQAISPEGGPPMRGGRGGGFMGRGGRGRGFGNRAFNGRTDFRHNSNSLDENIRPNEHLNFSNDDALFASVGPSGQVVACQGFPQNMQLSDLNNFFSEFPFDEQSVKIHLDNDGKSTGSAIVCLSSPEQKMTADAGPVLTNGITKDEVDIYDRQIRLWGLEAQNMLRNSSVLLVGVSPLGAEVTKNLMLCGLKALTIADSVDVDENDLSSNFLLQDVSAKINRATASSAKAKTLNPMVDFKAVEKGITDFNDEDLKNYDLIILLDQSMKAVKAYNLFCRANNIRFIAGSVFGHFGYAFFDFNDHFFLMKEPRAHQITGLDGAEGSAANETTLEEDVFKKEKLHYSSFAEALNVDWSAKKYIRKAKRLVPPSYVYVKAILRAQDQEVDLSSEKMSAIFDEERKKVHQADTIPDWTPEEAKLASGPQLSPVAAIVGGMIGQEAIKALSEALSPLRNLFVYSALHTTGHILHYPPD